ncbi:MAG: EAL domain-containing protein [Actinomycetia bacterium]|nr:EAL domain-containing protein [Actinomycetes bacterium]
MLAWLVAVILPFVGVGWFTIDLIDDRLTDRVTTDLANVRRLEAARLSEALADYEQDAVRLAAGPHVVDFVSAVTAARSGNRPREVVGGHDGFDVIDPGARRPLAQLVSVLQSKAHSTGSEVVEARFIGLDGSVYGTTSGFSWEPYDPEVVNRVLDDGQPRFGNAFRAPTGDDRLGLVAAIKSRDGDVVGALVLETNLGPIVDLVVEHEGFGDTSEAHIAQPTAEGDAEFITLLRFKRDAAFNVVVPASKGLPINTSLVSPGGQVLRSPDYRKIDSILAVETIEATGWGLVVKIDATEAFAPVGEVRRAIAAAGFLTVALIIVCTAVLLNPLGRRLRRLSLAAKRVASGRYQSSIDDPSRDEVGELARSIDQLAADLAADIEMRAVVENKLRHQVSHDDLTGIHNRHFAAQEIQLLSDNGGAAWSVLFLDLDGFKSINDSHGHGVGDEVLRAVAQRLSNAAPNHSTVARWGGDEFVLVLPATDRKAAQGMARKVRDLFNHPIATSIGEQQVRCSVGMATADADQSSLDDVLLEADSAMFAQKPSDRDNRRAWSTTERTVATALAENRVDVWFQPVLTSTMGDEVVVGAEALARLRTVDNEFIPPAEFLPAVIDHEVGVELDDYVARVAALTSASWLHQGLITERFQVSANLGSGSLRDPHLATRTRDLLDNVHLPSQMFALEISEAAEEINPTTLQRLRDIGVHVAIDDAGISHSNFDRLILVRPEVVKIDRRWLTDGEDESIVLSSLVETCSALELRMVAEGIETRQQQELILSLGIPYVQGFLFGQAIPASEFQRTWLHAAARVTDKH